MNNFVIIKTDKFNKNGNVLQLHTLPSYKIEEKLGDLYFDKNSYIKDWKYFELVNVYLLSDETPKSGDIVLTDNYGVWEFRERPCPVPYWGNPNTCKKILKSTDSEIEKFEQDELKLLIKEYNEQQTL